MVTYKAEKIEMPRQLCNGRKALLTATTSLQTSRPERHSYILFLWPLLKPGIAGLQARVCSPNERADVPVRPVCMHFPLPVNGAAGGPCDGLDWQKDWAGQCSTQVILEGKKKKTPLKTGALVSCCTPYRRRVLDSGRTDSCLYNVV